MEKKEYEIKDHLGNVRLAITDFKQPVKKNSTKHLAQKWHNGISIISKSLKYIQREN